MGFRVTDLTTLVLAGSDDAREQIEAAVRTAKGNMSAAARELKVSRATLYNYCARLGLQLDGVAQGVRGQAGPRAKA